MGQSEEEYPPTRVIDACRRERRFSLHHTRFLSRVDPSPSLPLSPHQTRESHGGRGKSPHRPGRSWARRPGVRPMTLASMSEECLPRHTGFLSRATNLKPSRPPRLNALSSTLSPPSKQRLAGYGIGPNPYPESPGQRLGPDIGNRSTDQKRVGLTDGQTTQVGRARRPAEKTDEMPLTPPPPTTALHSTCTPRPNQTCRHERRPSATPDSCPARPTSATRHPTESTTS